MRADPVDENQDALKAKLAFFIYQLHYLHSFNAINASNG
jgi:hypothetical protein